MAPKPRTGSGAKASGAAKRRQRQRLRVRQEAAAAADPARLLDEAEAAAAAGDEEAALALTEAAARAIGPGTSSELLERAGVRLLELGNPEAALGCLLRCVEAAPDAGHAKYFYLAQLHSGEAALAYLDRGVAVLTAAGPAADPGDLASAMCARCELFMTDLCDRPDAESQCEAALSAALAARPDGAEALQQRAGLRLVQQRPEAALADLRASLAVWLPKRRAAAEAAAESADPDECGLTGEQRLRCAEMLMELGQLETCLDVLDLLMEEDDELAQVWLLFGLAYGRLGNASAARYHLERARALVEPGDPVAMEIDQLLADLPAEEASDAAAVAKDAAAPAADCDCPEEAGTVEPEEGE